ncbi:Maf family protein [Microbaculum marinisediminis]|uniref:Nucleoside triphosphate pyrophosphatase n=1 Tax=Microbaculum marinisediminis TaxID=2931392 RepID=A0AAW5R0L7_9HYPH|nr:Maf family protein [Microbaculum sp. A6E488]MCT8972208.1 Maf family protein [Microbaculum sp. A6E488]
MTHDRPLALKPVVLASASRTRRSLLEAVGLDVEAVPSGLDERAMIDAIVQDTEEDLPPADVASVLAAAKADAVSANRPGAIVIGADQTLELDGELFVKPESIEQARSNLLRLRGKTHLLHAAVAIVRDGEQLWSTLETAALTMRDFTPQFLGRYSVAAGEDMLDSVGSYRVEGLGLQLFEHIDGDHATILGLPLLPVLAELRKLGVVEK